MAAASHEVVLQPKVVSANQNLNSVDEEEARSTSPNRGGGWISFPFVSVSLFGLTLASSGLLSNLIVYLIQQFNIKSIDAAQIFNIVSGCTNLLPIAGAIIADSFVGNFTVIAITSFISLLGMILLMLTATIHSLRPQHCGTGRFCTSPSTLEYAVLYTAIIVSTIGFGGQRFTIATLGADQFEKPKEHAIFFNWYFIILYVAAAIGLTGIVYIQDNVGWNWGYGICVVANAIGLVVFVFGKRYYRHVKPNGSPFTRLARVIVATVRKRKVSVSSSTEAKAYYYGCSTIGSTSTSPTSSFRFLNRAAFKTEGDTNEYGLITKPWRLCTVQQVEDLKTLIRIFPLWSTSIFLSTPIGIQSSLLVLQALTMDRHLGPNFKIPAATFLVFTLITTAISLVLIDRFLFTTYHKLTHRSLTPLQRIGTGHILTILGMAASALVESKRLHVARSNNIVDQPNSIVPLSALWLVGPLAIVGIGEAFHFPGQVALYYEEFPKSLKSTATAMIALLVAAGFYLSTALIHLVRKVTGWLPDNINKGRIDNVFWLLVVVGVINFSYYLICAVLYKYQNVEKSSVVVDDDHDQK